MEIWTYGPRPRPTQDDDSHKATSKFPRPLLLNLVTGIPESSTSGLHDHSQGLSSCPHVIRSYWKVPEDSIRWFTQPNARSISCLYVTKSFQKVLSVAHIPKTTGSTPTYKLLETSIGGHLPRRARVAKGGCLGIPPPPPSATNWPSLS
jgi:hypothetical protein